MIINFCMERDCGPEFTVVEYNVRSVEHDNLLKYFYKHASDFRASPYMLQKGMITFVIEVSLKIELKKDA